VVRTLRRIRQLRSEDVPVTAGQTDGETWTMNVAGDQVIGLSVNGACAWLNGYVTGLRSSGDLPASTLGDVRTLLTAPTDGDRSRLTLLGLMYGRGRDNEISTYELERRTGVSRKTIFSVLQFGTPVSNERLDQLMGALGHQWADRKLRTGVVRMSPAPEMPGIARLRRIMEAEDAGWLAYVDTGDPNQARRLGVYKIAVGAEVHEVPADELDDWLAGLTYYWQSRRG
jgi:hypothetical protein